jgi:hypothetical protein
LKAGHQQTIRKVYIPLYAYLMYKVRQPIAIQLHTFTFLHFTNLARRINFNWIQPRKAMPLINVKAKRMLLINDDVIEMKCISIL